MHIRHPGQRRIEMVPWMPARCEHHHLRLESRGIIERADIDADHVRHILRFVVERRAATAAKSLALSPVLTFSTTSPVTRIAARGNTATEAWPAPVSLWQSRH